MMSCQCSTGIWLVTIVEARPWRSSRISRRSYRISAQGPGRGNLVAGRSRGRQSEGSEGNLHQRSGRLSRQTSRRGSRYWLLKRRPPHVDIWSGPHWHTFPPSPRLSLGHLGRHCDDDLTTLSFWKVGDHRGQDARTTGSSGPSSNENNTCIISFVLTFPFMSLSMTRSCWASGSPTGITILPPALS